MKTITAMIPICLACLLIMAAGCTGTTGTAPETTPTATSAPAAGAPWSGTWDTGSSTPAAYQTVGILILTQTSSSVTGTFSNNDHGKGTLIGTVSENQLTGTWSMDYGYKSDSGSFKFVLSDDDTSFTGTWVAANDTTGSLSSTSDFWNGKRR